METVNDAVDEFKNADVPPPDMIDDTPPDDEGAELEAKPTFKRPRPKPRRPFSPPPASSPMREIERSDQESIRDWIGAISNGVPVKINISRKKPMLGPNGERIAGSLETVDELIDEEYIRETWGGGEFMLRVNTLRGDGGYKWFKNRTIQIAGEPKMFGKSLGDAGDGVQAVPSINNSMAERAFNSMEQLARDERSRAEAAMRESNRPAPGMDFAALSALQAPMLEELRALRDANANLQSQIIALSTKPPPRDEFRDTMMSKMVEGESARIESLRIGYDQRIEKLRDNHEDAIKRLDDRHRDEIRRIEDAHKRELAHVEKAGEKSGETSKQGYDMRIDTLKETIGRLERELAAAATKIAALEAKKDQTIGEKADELIKVKEALDGIGGGDDDDKEKPWYERIIDVAGNSEAALAFINKLGGGPPKNGPPNPQQPQPQLPPPGVPFQTGDGNVYVRDAEGRTHIINQGQLKKQRAIEAARARRAATPPAQPGQPPQPGQPSAPPEVEEPEDESESAEEAALELDENEVRIALSFMENAIKNGTPAEKFAQSARNLVPGDVIAFLQQYGVRKLLGMVKLDANSPLTTVKGRQFAEKVSKVLIGEA